MDYYAILGLDPDASQASIKIAFRRLARENHPDLLAGRSEQELAAASRRMAEINEAYAVLSRSANGSGKVQHSVAHRTATVEPVVASPAPSASRIRGTDRSAVSSSVLVEVGRQLRARLTGPGSLAWRDTEWEGFEFAVTTASWNSWYGVGARGFPDVNPGAVGTLTTYAELAIHRSRSYFRRQHFLFVVPFQRILNPDLVRANCRQFCAAQQKTAGVWIALVDVTHGKSLVCGGRVENPGLQVVLQNLGLAVV